MIFAEGNPTANLMVTDPSTATLGANVTATSTLGNLSINATTNDAGVKSNTDAEGGGFVKAVSSTSTTTLKDAATSMVGVGSSLTALLGTILVQSTTTADANATAGANGGGVGDISSATATTTVTAPSLSTVGEGATLSADIVRINAQGAATSTQGATTRSAVADATSTAGAVGTTNSATATVNSTFTSAVDIAQNTTVTGTSEVDLTADSGPVVSNADPTANSTALGGKTDSTSTNTANYGATVTTEGGTVVPGNFIPVPNSNIVAGNLLVSANTPAATLMTQDNRTTAAVDTGSASATPMYSPTNNVSFDSVATILGAGPRLHIGPQGQVLQQTGGVTFRRLTNEISVDPITSAMVGMATFRTTGDGSKQITGTGIFHFGTGFGAVILTNDSPMDFLIHDITVTNPNAAIALTIDPTLDSGFYHMVDLGAIGLTRVTITNTGHSNLYLAGKINNPLGITTIKNTDTGASASTENILPQGSGQLVVTGQLTLSSASGAIGSTANRLGVELVQSSILPATIEAGAAGPLALDITGLNETTSAFLGTGTVLGSTADLRIEDGIVQSGSTMSPQATSYVFSQRALHHRALRQRRHLDGHRARVLRPGRPEYRQDHVERGRRDPDRPGCLAGRDQRHLDQRERTERHARSRRHPGHNDRRRQRPVHHRLVARWRGPGHREHDRRYPPEPDQRRHDHRWHHEQHRECLPRLERRQPVRRRRREHVGGLRGAGRAYGRERRRYREDSACGDPRRARGERRQRRALPREPPGADDPGAAGYRYPCERPGQYPSAGAMVIAEQVSTTSGSITLAPINNPAAGEDFTLDSNVSISSNGGPITIDAAGNVTLSDGSVISTNPIKGPPSGSITILGDTQAPGTGGSTITVSGRLVFPTTQVTTGQETDNVLVTRLPYQSVLSVDTGVDAAGTSGDTLTIDGDNSSDAWTISSNSVNVTTASGSATINYTNVYSLNINAKPAGDSGNDTFIVNGTGAETLTTIDAGNGSNTLTVNASASGGAAVQNTALFYVGGHGANAGPNAVSVNGAGEIADTFVLANEPTNPNEADVVGSGIILRYEFATSLNLSTAGTESYTAVYGTLVPTTITAAKSNNLELGDSTVQTAPAVSGVDGNPIQPPGNLSNFNQPVIINDPTRSSTLTIIDRNDSDTHYASLNANSITGLSEPNPSATNPHHHVQRAVEHGGHPRLGGGWHVPDQRYVHVHGRCGVHAARRLGKRDGHRPEVECPALL